MEEDIAHQPVSGTKEDFERLPVYFTSLVSVTGALLQKAITRKDMQVGDLAVC